MHSMRQKKSSNDLPDLDSPEQILALDLALRERDKSEYRLRLHSCLKSWVSAAAMRAKMGVSEWVEGLIIARIAGDEWRLILPQRLWLLVEEQARLAGVLPEEFVVACVCEKMGIKTYNSRKKKDS